MPNKTALKLPDALLVRYFRAGEIERVKTVSTLKDQRIRVVLAKSGKDTQRTDHWRDLGGGLGYVPDTES
jgi:hypothetical protein